MKTKRDRLSVLTRNAAFILVGGVLSTQAGCYQTVSPRPARTVTVVQAPWPAAGNVLPLCRSVRRVLRARRRRTLR